MACFLQEATNKKKCSVSFSTHIVAYTCRSPLGHQYFFRYNHINFYFYPVLYNWLGLDYAYDFGHKQKTTVSKTSRIKLFSSLSVFLSLPIFR